MTIIMTTIWNASAEYIDHHNSPQNHSGFMMIIVTTNDYQSRIYSNHHDHHMTVMLSLHYNGTYSRLLTTNVFVKSLSAFWRASRARMPCRMALTVFIRLFSVCASGTASPAHRSHTANRLAPALYSCSRPSLQ